MNQEITTFGRVKRHDDGVGFENGSGLWIEDENVRLVVEVGVRTWVRRGDGRSGWLEIQAGQSVRTQGQAGDVYLIGDEGFWQKQPEEILAEPQTSLGSGAVVRLVNVVSEVVAVVQSPMRVPEAVVTDMSFTAKTKNLKDFFAQRLPHRVEEVGFVINGGEANSDKPVQRKRLMAVGMASLVLVGMLTAVGHVRRAHVARATSSQNLMIENIVAQYREAKAIVGIDPDRSRQLVTQAQSAMETLTGDYATDQRLAEVRSGIGEVLGQATGTFQLTPTVLIDLHLLREGMEGQEMTFGDERLWVLDTKGGRVVQVKTDTGAGEVKFSQTTFGTPQLLASYPGKLFILSDKGIVECTLASGACSVKIEKDTEWGNIASMGVWAGNIYLLDSGRSMIWRYVLGDTGYGKKQEWLDTTEGTEQFSLGSSTSLAIDGNLWAMESSSAMIKYTRGVGERITLSGLDAPLGKSLELYTSDEIENIYILDRDHHRIVDVNKSGMYVSQWSDESLGSARGFTVNEKSGTMWWVQAAKVWSARLVK